MAMLKVVFGLSNIFIDFISEMRKTDDIGGHAFRRGQRLLG